MADRPVFNKYTSHVNHSRQDADGWKTYVMGVFRETGLGDESTFVGEMRKSTPPRRVSL